VDGRHVAIVAILGLIFAMFAMSGAFTDFGIGGPP
jgi:hypothetical protein